MRKNARFLVLALITLSVACQKESFQNIKSGSADMASADTASGDTTALNIILILADDMGYEIPNYTGGESYLTPNLNYLAANGIQFTQAHTAPLCSPSRFMLLSAKYNYRNYTTWGSMDTSQRTIANLLKKAGYATCMAGKWQFDGGNASIKKFGFDRYLVTNPFKVPDDEKIRFYKDPEIYEKGAYWPDIATKGKYGEDLIKNYMFHFIDSISSLPSKKPFFIYWAPNLIHKPFCPTPDDPQFATWHSNRIQQPDDSIYFPSMVKYHDKQIGQLIQKLRTKKILSKT
jgi:arylsulfatase A